MGIHIELRYNEDIMENSYRIQKGLYTVQQGQHQGYSRDTAAIPGDTIGMYQGYNKEVAGI